MFKLDYEHPRIYNIWRSMKKRCYYPKQDSYRYYGARGITVCIEWMQYKIFCEWALANGYGDDLTIDRKDSDGNYEPDNCRRITMRDQNRRHRNCISITYESETRLVIDWAREYGIKLPTLYWRLHHGWNIDRALNTPINIHFRHKIPV